MEKYVFVLVTTKHRGVFAGELVDERESGRTVVLRRARCAIRWATTGGFLELAQIGPNKNSKVGTRADGDVVLYDVTSCATCSVAAMEAWENA